MFSKPRPRHPLRHARLAYRRTVRVGPYHARRADLDVVVVIPFLQEPFDLETELSERLLDDLQSLVEYSDRCPRSIVSSSSVGP